MGGYHVGADSLKHNCPETSACIKIITSKIQKVDFWDPLPSSALAATSLGNPNSGITLKTTLAMVLT